MTRIALIGAGGVAQRHARVLSDLPDVSIAAVADVSLPAATALADTVGARAFDDVEAALDDGPVDAAYVCVPPFAHGAPEEAVLARRLPLFVEKPVGLDLDTLDRLETLVEEAGVVTGTGYHWRCLDHLAVARELFATSRPLLAHGYWLDKRPPVAWWQRRDRSGGQVVEQLAHVLDLARSLFGEAVEVHAFGARLADEDRRPGTLPEGVTATDVDDATGGVVRFASGTVLTIGASCALSRKFGAGLDVVATGAHVSIGEEGLVLDRGTGEPERHERGADPRVAIDENFVAAVRGEIPAAIAPWADAASSHRLAMALADSAAADKPVVPRRSGTSA